MIIRLRPLLALLAGLSFLGSFPAFSQTIEFSDGTVGYAKLHKRLAAGPAQAILPDAATAAASTGLVFTRKPFLSLESTMIPIYVVGSDPGAGAGTTVIPTVIVPLKFVFPDAGNPVLDGTSRVAEVQNSPLFQNTSYTADGVDLGFTQYGDAIQRAEFWNYPGFSQTDYHVLLGLPTIAPTVMITVPSTGCGADGTASCGTAVLNSRGVLVGRLDIDYFGSLLTPLVQTYSANILPIFQTDNVFLYEGTPDQCCVLGYHDSEGPPVATARTWIYHAYTESGTFRGDGFVDVVPLSHEVSEWLNDPFVGAFSVVNWVAPYVLPGQGGACQPNFETGDVLEALLPDSSFTKTIGDITYHLQDEAFLPYFLHGTPFSVNGWYTLLNNSNFQTPSTLCGPG